MKHRLIDLSHTIHHGLKTYKELPAPTICDYWTREESAGHYSDGSSFHIGKMELVSNTGTYLDTPFHRFANGKDTSQMSLHQLVGLPAIKIVAHQKAVPRSLFEDKALKNKAVLIQTNWCEKWGTESYFEDHPFLSEEAAEFLVDQKVGLIGIDSYNIDNTGASTRPVHTLILGHSIPIVEHLCRLDFLPDEGFTFTAVPPKIKGMGTFPVRAFAEIF